MLTRRRISTLTLGQSSYKQSTPKSTPLILEQLTPKPTPTLKPMLTLKPTLIPKPIPLISTSALLAIQLTIIKTTYN